MDRQATPLLVSPDGAASKLPRLGLKTGGRYDELWLQRLVHAYPSVLPISPIEPAFWPATPVCMELPLRSGFVDNLLVTALGDLVVVECKLWRNVEARRKVLAQIIDYAKDLQAISYAELENSIRTARKEPNYELYRDLSTKTGPDVLEESAFIDAVSRNLERARMLLLIVGDGITENIAAMADFFQQHVGLHFALALVQLAIHELPGTEQLLVLPSIPLRTTNVVRGIVEFGSAGAKIVAPPETPRSTAPTTLTAEELFHDLDRIQPFTSERLVRLLADLGDLHVSWEVRRTLIVRMVLGDVRLSPFVINSNGTVDMGYNVGAKDLVKDFANKLASTIPNAIVREMPTTWAVKRMDGSFLTVWDLLDHAAEVRTAVELLNKTLKSAQQD